ncbi:Sulfate anion transporter [Trichinella spiralis]|uniref:Sulfate anion transporter n=1 Tax=Trichinella spiralis TaxID=6334 RepID=A0ABR3L1Y2_TRISP
MDGEKFRRRCSSTLQIRQNAVIKIVPDVTDSSATFHTTLRAFSEAFIGTAYSSAWIALSSLFAYAHFSIVFFQLFSLN